MASPHISPRPIGLSLEHSSGSSSSIAPTSVLPPASGQAVPSAPTSAPTSQPVDIPHSSSHTSMLEMADAGSKRSMLDIGDEYIAKSHSPRAPLSRQTSAKQASQMQTSASSSSIKTDYARSTASSIASNRTGPSRQNTNIHSPPESGTISTFAQTPSKPAVQRAPTNSKGDMHKAPPAASHSATADKPKLMSRVSSFLHRKKPSEHTTEIPGASTDAKLTKTTSKGSFNDFNFSSRSSATSKSGTPPSPGSPSSTVQEAESLPDESTLEKHMHSSSATDLQGQGGPVRPRMGITWGPGEGAPSRSRGRSASNEHVPSIFRKPNMGAVVEEDEPAGFSLPLAFSRDAREGAGLKARRLSTALPDEFWVDTVELDSEFQSASIIPFHRGKLVGKGGTASVRTMCRKGEAKGFLYAVKEFRLKEKDETQQEYEQKLKSEYAVAKSLHHPNIVETFRLCTQRGRYNHVMEYCVIGDLYGLAHKGLFRTHYTVADRLCFFKQTLRGVDYLHSHGIAHRDLKLENLLMNGEGHIKITDFGVSEVFSGSHPGLRAAAGQCGKNMGEVRRCAPGICGSMPYIAPEVLAKEGDYDPRPLDVWSTALVYIAMVYSGVPWNIAKTSVQLGVKPDAANTNYDDFSHGWEKWLDKHPEPDAQITDTPGGAPNCGKFFNAVERLGSPAIKRILLRMLHPIPERRASIREVLEHPIIRGIECCTSAYSEEACLSRSNSGESIDAARPTGAKKKMDIQKKHNHLPPKEHKTPKALQHRFDMGHGWY